MFGIVSGLLSGWILSFFGFDNLVMNGMNELFGVHITMTGYYFICAVIGALSPSSSALINFKLFEFKKINH